MGDQSKEEVKAPAQSFPFLFCLVQEKKTIAHATLTSCLCGNIGKSLGGSRPAGACGSVKIDSPSFHLFGFYEPEGS